MQIPIQQQKQYNNLTDHKSAYIHTHTQTTLVVCIITPVRLTTFEPYCITYALTVFH